MLPCEVVQANYCLKSSSSNNRSVYIKNIGIQVQQRTIQMNYCANERYKHYNTHATIHSGVKSNISSVAMLTSLATLAAQ